MPSQRGLSDRFENVRDRVNGVLNRRVNDGDEVSHRHVGLLEGVLALAKSRTDIVSFVP